MTSVPGVDHPEEQSEAEVTLTDRGISVSTRVESASGGEMTVRPSVSEFVERAVAAVGDQVEVFWKTGEETRALPAEVVQVGLGAAPRWQLRTTGPAEVSQRRHAVRGRVALPVQLSYGSVELTGDSIDVSEVGVRVVCDGLGVPPAEGDTVGVVLELEDAALRSKAEVVRFQARGSRWLLSIRFLDLPEREGDRVRRRVFRALREERARNAG